MKIIKSIRKDRDDTVVIRNQNRGVSLPTLIGAVIAAYCSWQINHSIFWAAIHALFNWVYLLYLCAGCGGGLPHNVPW